MCLWWGWGGGLKVSWAGFGIGSLLPIPIPNPAQSQKMGKWAENTNSLVKLGCHAIREKSFFCRSQRILTY